MELIEVEVVDARPRAAKVVTVKVEAGATLRQVIERSGLAVDPANCTAGVFGKLRKLDEIVQPGDRIEIYRPLRMDPKDRRRRLISSA